MLVIYFTWCSPSVNSAHCKHELVRILTVSIATSASFTYIMTQLHNKSSNSDSTMISTCILNSLGRLFVNHAILIVKNQALRDF